MKEAADIKPPKILIERTERTSFLKRTTYYTVEMNGKTVNVTRNHFARPIDVIIMILDSLAPYRMSVRVGETIVQKWKLPFQNGLDVLADALSEAWKEEQKKENGKKE